jgi:hypothetical protein
VTVLNVIVVPNHLICSSEDDITVDFVEICFVQAVHNISLMEITLNNQQKNMFEIASSATKKYKN